MKRSRRGTLRTHAGIWAAVVALLLTGAPTSASGAPGSNHGRGAEHRSARADAALDAAKALFLRHQGSVAADGARRTPVTWDSSQVTAVLRDLAVSLDDLTASQRRTALRILARPTDGAQESWPGIKYDGAPTTDSCTAGFAAHVCLHWVAAKNDDNSPPAEDLKGLKGVPDWVETNQRVLDEVWQKTVVGLGYGPPVSDLGASNHGPNERTDVYLADLGQYGLYGYCAAEPPLQGSTAPAYCVIDDDFAEFPGMPLNDLRVTAAHEFFHAIQYSYNVFADVWLMEGTAAWVEDEIYDDINDNLQYLALSPLKIPGAPLDYAGVADPNRPNDVNWRYGSWIWWRFLSERFGRGD
jgi:hypothetical protein